MANAVIKAAIKALLPEGALWMPAEDEDLDKFLDGVSENWDTARKFLYDIGFTRDPLLTPLLDELEREFGILPDFDLIEYLRRQQLSALKNDRTDAYATAQDLEEFLNNAGFDVQVHKNSPAVDPALFPGDILVTTRIYDTLPAYLFQCGGATSFCGHIDAACGRFDDYIYNDFEYILPTDPKKWPLIFWVGGPATRDPGTGALTSIAPADVPLNRKNRFIEFILKTKPWFTWAILVINYN